MSHYTPSQEYELVEVNKILLTPLISSYLDDNDVEYLNEVIPEHPGIVRKRLDTTKLENINEAFSSNIPIPPIKVQRLIDGTYSIKNGIHRTAMSITYSFSHIPVQVENSPTTTPKWKPRNRK